MDANIARLEDRLLVACSPVGVPAYDFDFETYFACDHPFRLDRSEACVLRIGAVDDYAAKFVEFGEIGLVPINSPEEHRRASDFEGWYPLISDLTPESRVFDVLPDADSVSAEFGWPVFVRGSRQTSRHDPSLAIARDPQGYSVLCKRYRDDPILHWQRPVIRRYVHLDRIAGRVPGKITPSREFRTFWWRGTLVGHGCYWFQLPRYDSDDLNEGLTLAAEAARRVDAPFLVIDIARLVDGGWIVIECNDGQESGYAGVIPQMLWRNILDLV